MPKPVSAGARVVLDVRNTSAEHLGVAVGIFVELDDARRIEIDPWQRTYGGPRRSLGAVWVRYDGDGSELPCLDRELWERDPDTAITQALVQCYRLQPKDIEDQIRQDLFDGGPPAAPPQDGGTLDPEDYQRQLDAERDASWMPLVGALRDAGIAATPASMRELRFLVQFDQAVLDELSRNA